MVMVIIDDDSRVHGDDDDDSVCTGKSLYCTVGDPQIQTYYFITCTRW